VNTADEPPLSARETIKALGAYARPHRWGVALGLLCALIGTAGGCGTDGLSGVAVALVSTLLK
jgi:hypothetical protein